MVEITFVNGKGQKVISSVDVEQELKINADFEYVNDISGSISQKNVMVFDCKLDQDIFHFEDMDEDMYDELGIDEEYLQVFFEDIVNYINDISEDVEQDFRDEYKVDGIRASAQVYDLDESFTDVKFVLLISFKEMPRKQLTDLTRIVAKRQLEGSSKYFN